MASAGVTRAIRVSSAARFEALREGNLDLRGRGIDRGATEVEEDESEARRARCKTKIMRG